MTKDEKSTIKRKSAKSSKTEVPQVSAATNSAANKDHQSILAAFRQHLVNEGKTNTTIKSYVGDVETYFNYIHENGKVVDGVLDKECILEYKKRLIERSARAATINTVLNSLRSYNMFAIKASYMKEMVLDTKTERVTNKELTALKSDKKPSAV